jgi:hypothetical protein
VVRFVILLLLFLFNLSPANAQDLIPGSYTYEYGGLYKIAADESSRFLVNRWSEQERLWHNHGAITFGDFLKRRQSMFVHLDDWRDGPPWWTRDWFHSLEEKNGGAPPNKSITVKYGSSFKIIDTPLFSVSNSFSFSWKSFQAAVDFKSSTPIMFGMGSIPAPKFGWKFRVAPEFKFSAFKIFNNPMRSVRRIGFRFIATHWIRKPIVSIEIQVWHNPIRKRGFVGVQLVLLQW